MKIREIEKGIVFYKDELLQQAQPHSILISEQKYVEDVEHLLSRIKELKKDYDNYRHDWSLRFEEQARRIEKLEDGIEYHKRMRKNDSVSAADYFDEELYKLIEENVK